MSDDPGGVFASDAHRRVMANLPNPNQDPLSVEGLQAERIAKDDYLDISDEDLTSVLSDLEADGHAIQTPDGWQNTERGFTALTVGPDPTAAHGPAISEEGS